MAFIQTHKRMLLSRIDVLKTSFRKMELKLIAKNWTHISKIQEIGTENGVNSVERQDWNEQHGVSGDRHGDYRLFFPFKMLKKQIKE
jgi:hypothetical protein